MAAERYASFKLVTWPNGCRSFFRMQSIAMSSALLTPGEYRLPGGSGELSRRPAARSRPPMCPKNLRQFARHHSILFQPQTSNQCWLK